MLEENDAVSNEKINSKKIPSKATFGNIYCKRPIFRRKLIEKYSTARYNFNTKLFLKKRPRPDCRKRTSKNAKNEKYKNAGVARPSSSSLQNALAAQKEEETACEVKTETLNDQKVDDGRDRGTIHVDENAEDVVQFNDEAGRRHSNSGATTISCGNSCANDSNKMSWKSLNKNKKYNSCANNESSKLNETWKIAPKGVYDRLWETYVGKYEVKAEPKKEVIRKRKRGGYRKKHSVNVKNKTENLSFCDPYDDCVRELDDVPESTCRKNEKLGIVMYLGVHRPIFPLVYRNIRLLNGNNDAQITDFWSEFALSTLVTKEEDKKCAPVLVSVKDPELYSLISELDDRSADAELLDVSKSTQPDSDIEKKCEVDVDVDIKVEHDAYATQRKSRRQRTPRELDVQRWLQGVRKREREREQDQEREHDFDNESISVSLSQKSNSLVSPTASKTIDQKLDEKLILKQYGYKECVVAIPKLGDREVRAIMGDDRTTDSNRTEQDRAPAPEKVVNEPTEEYHYFGTSRCTRTYGVMIDYLPRNRTLVHYYKLKKMLDFQNSNNKYFTCCDYILIDRCDTQDDVDVTSTDSDETEDTRESESESENLARKPFRWYALGIAESEFQPKVRSSRNPNDIFPYSRIKEFKDRTVRFSWVKMDKFRCLSNVKWLALKLDKSIASICFAEQHVLRHRLLFEIVYRAELSKKVICCELDGGQNNVDQLTFGVYAFPGLCDVVYVGPYALDDQHNLIASVRVGDGQVKLGKIKTQEEKENFSQAEQSVHIQAKWWEPNKKIRCQNPNDRYLEFVFHDPATISTPQADKCNIANILDQHDCLNYHTYEIGGGKEYNFVLFHDLTNTLHNSQSAPSAPAKRKVNIAKQRSIIERFLKRRRNDDEFEPNVSRKTPRKLLEGSAVYTLKDGVLRKRSRNPARLYTKMHVTNERIRRLEFRNYKLNLASVLKENVPITPMESLVSILQKSMEMVQWLEKDTARQIEEGKLLRKQQTVLMKKCVTLLKGFDPKSTAYKRGMNFLAKWKEMKLGQRTALVELLQQNNEEKFVSYAHNNKQNGKRKTFVRPSERFFGAVKTSKPNVGHMNRENLGSSQSITKICVKNPAKPESASVEQPDENILQLDPLEHRPPADGASSNNEIVEKTNTSPRTLRQQQQQQQQQRRRRRQPWSRPSRSKLQVEKIDDVLAPKVLNLLSTLASSENNITSAKTCSTETPSPIGTVSTCNEEYKIMSTSMPYVEHSYCLLNENANNSNTQPSSKNHLTKNTEGRKPSLADRYRERYRKTSAKPATSVGPIVNGTMEGPSFRAVIKEKSSDQVSIDIMENNHIFARLNIAKIRSQTGDSTAGGIGSDSKTKILNLMQKILSKMQSSVSVSNESERRNDERSRVVKRALLVQKLKSLIGKFEESKKERMYETIDSIEISDEESDPMDRSNNYSQGDEKNEIDLHAEEEFVLEEEEEEEEEDGNGIEEQVLNASSGAVNQNSVASLCFDDDSETANIENVIIEEVYDDDGGGEDDIDNLIINDVSSVETISSSKNAAISCMDNSLRFIPVVKRTNSSSNNSKKRVPVPILPKPVHAVSSAGNVLIHPKPKIKFVPNIIKFSEKPTNANDFTRIKVKTASPTFVSLSEMIHSPISKRKWCTPASNVENHPDEPSRGTTHVTDMDETNECGEIVHSPSDDTVNATCETSETNYEFEMEGYNRVGLRPKPFACVGKFDQVFSNNVDKLLNPF